MKSILSTITRLPLPRIGIAGARAGIAGAVYAWLAGERWHIALLTSAGGMLVQGLELVWTRYKMRAVRKTKHKAPVAK